MMTLRYVSSDGRSKITVIVIIVFDLLARTLFVGAFFLVEAIFITIYGEIALASRHYIFVLTGITSSIGPVIFGLDFSVLKLTHIPETLLVSQLLLFP